MKEITRIHIARIAYDIELGAKKQLESYLKQLESYGGDSEIVDDIEIRMTEILAERGVKKGGVIGGKDVDALKQQLGEPSEIMGETRPVSTKDESVRSTRKLFRDTDNAVVGGVLSGIGAFFGVSPIWTRLLFIVSLFASAGAAFLVYIVLWMVVPAARTAADKLQMRGEAITAASIKKLNDTEATLPTRSGGISGRKVFMVLVGVGASFAAVLSAFVTFAAVVAVVLRKNDAGLEMGTETGFIVTAFILAVISGLLLTVLCIVVAYAAFSQRMTRRVAMIIGTIIVLGIVSFGSGLGFAQYAKFRHDAVIEANTHEEAIAIPTGSASVKALDAQVSKGTRIVYSVTNGPLKATLRTVSESKNNTSVTATIKEDTLTVSYDSKTDACTSFLCHDKAPLIMIEGPSLVSLHATEGVVAEYNGATQENLSVEMAKNATVRTVGSIASLDASLEESAYLSVDQSTVQKLTVHLASTAEINAGTVADFILDHPSACGQGDNSVVVIERVSSERMIVNGVARKAETTNLACANIIVHNRMN